MTHPFAGLGQQGGCGQHISTNRMMLLLASRRATEVCPKSKTFVDQHLLANILWTCLVKVRSLFHSY